MSGNQNIHRIIEAVKGKRVLLLTTSNRWEGQNEIPKSTELARMIEEKVPNAKLIDVSKLTIYPCEGNVSTRKGNQCGLSEAALQDSVKNPSGHHRCWASLNHEDDELWKVSKELLEADVVLFFASIRWGQTNSIYQKLIERLDWLENRWTTLGESNLLQNKEAGIIIVGHNWNGLNTLNIQKEVLKFYGFEVSESLSFNWQWTTDLFDESEEGYYKDSRDFDRAFELGPKWLSESYKNWFEQNGL